MLRKPMPITSGVTLSTSTFSTFAPVIDEASTNVRIAKLNKKTLEKCFDDALGEYQRSTSNGTLTATIISLLPTFGLSSVFLLLESAFKWFTANDKLPPEHLITDKNASAMLARFFEEVTKDNYKEKKEITNKSFEFYVARNVLGISSHVDISDDRAKTIVAECFAAAQRSQLNTNAAPAEYQLARVRQNSQGA